MTRLDGTRNPGLVARLQILGAAALFSTGGAAIKACSLTAWQVAGSRSALGAVLLFAFLKRARCRWSWRTVLVGSCYGATLILFVWSNRLTTALNPTLFPGREGVAFRVRPAFSQNCERSFSGDSVFHFILVLSFWRDLN